MERVIRVYESGVSEFNERWRNKVREVDTGGREPQRLGFPTLTGPPRQADPAPPELPDVDVGRVAGVERVDVTGVLSGRSPALDLPWPEEFDGDEGDELSGPIDPRNVGSEVDSEGEDGLGRFGGIWEAIAWYCPIRTHGPEWGIYITRRGIAQLARSIAPHWVEQWSPHHGQMDARQVTQDLRRVAFALLLFHEAYHHQVEAFSLTAPRGRDDEALGLSGAVRYALYMESVYQPTWGSDQNLEEALAVASSFRGSLDPAGRLRALGFNVPPGIGDLPFEAARRWMLRNVPRHREGYRNGLRVVSDPAFRSVEQMLVVEWVMSPVVSLVRSIQPDLTGYIELPSLDPGSLPFPRRPFPHVDVHLDPDSGWFEAPVGREVENLMSPKSSSDPADLRFGFSGRFEGAFDGCAEGWEHLGRAVPSTTTPFSLLAERVFLVD